VGLNRLEESTVTRLTIPLTLLLLFSSPLLADTLAVSGVRVFDGASMIETATVVVEDGTIIAVGPDVSIPDGAETVDGSGATLLPGFIDCHTHTWGDALERAAVFGVTTELDMFTDPEFAPGGHGTQFGIEVPTLTQADQADGWVADRLAEGSDYIKIVLEDGELIGRAIPTLDDELLAALVSAVQSRERLALAHVSTLADARMAVASGVDGLVHIFRDAPADEALVTLVASRGVFVVPTLTVVESTSGGASGALLVDDLRFEFLLTPQEIAGLKTSFPPAPGVSPASASESVRRLHEAGVTILAGTDAPNPGTAHGVSIHRELELLVAAGLDPVAALAAATSAPARAFGLEDRGRIAPGLRADLVLVEGDPGEDITATRAIRAVWKGGKTIDRPRQELPESGQPMQAGSLADFESGLLAASFGAGWTASTDEMMGGKSTVGLAVVDAGATGTSKALAVSGEIVPGFAFPWAGAMFFAGDAPMAPANLSTVSQIVFQAKGTPGTYRLMAFAETLGQVPSGQLFEVEEEWREVTLSVDGFRGADFSGLTALLWTGGPALGAFELVIDEIELRE